MAKPQQSPFPQDVVIGPNWQIVFDAIDPVTGDSVSGVNLSGVNVTATNVGNGEPVVVKPLPPILVAAPDEV